MTNGPLPRFDFLTWMSANLPSRLAVRAYEQLLIKFGIPHEVHLWPLDVHVFPAAHWLPEARQALDSIAEFVNDLPSVAARTRAA